MLAGVGAAVAAVALTVANVAQLGLDPATDALEAADIGALAEAGADEAVSAAAETGGDEAASAGAETGTDEAPAEDEPATGENDGETCETGGQSFTAGTLVLLASGKAIPISQLKVGDKVLAADTKTGKDQPETVTAVLVHHDTDLYNLTVKTSTGTEVIHTTSNHLFWDPAARQWVKAAALHKGEPLRTPDSHATAYADGGRVPANPDGWMWDLTVPGNNDHDFYVIAQTGAVPVLVHNNSNLECNEEGVPDPEPQYKQSGGRNRGSAVYINVMGEDGEVTTAGSNAPADLHAEDVAQARVPGGQMSQPYGWRTPPGGDAPQWTPIEVCGRCQATYPQDLLILGRHPIRGVPGMWPRKPEKMSWVI